MIKQIQLRGISRSPSDRMTSDGGCAESLNVQLDHGELTPMPKPEDLTEKIMGEDSGTVLYVHNGTYYSNYIYGYWTSGYIFSLCARVEGEKEVLKTWSISGGESYYWLPNITSVGNTLIVSFRGEMWYFLFKDGAYRSLGNQIPIPKIRFYMKPDSERVEPSISDVTKDTDCNTELVTMGREVDYGDLNIMQWGVSENAYKVQRDSQRAVISNILDRINLSNAIENRNSKCIFPVFVRYAARLYDGSLYACSVPILMGADLSSYLAIKLKSKKSGLDSTQAKWYTSVITKDGTVVVTEAYEVGAVVRFPSAYRIVADFSHNELNGTDWEDIVTGIDFFVSTPIFPIEDNTAIRLWTNEYYDELSTSGSTIYRYYLSEATLDPINFSSRPENLLLAHQQTYLAKSWTLEELSNLGEVELNDIDYTGDSLSVKEAMKETYNSNHFISGDKLESYNNRLLLEGAKLNLSHGYPFFSGTRLYSSAAAAYAFVWHLRVDGEEKIVVSKDAEGGNYILSREAGNYYDRSIGWASYPDGRAFKVDVHTIVGGVDKVKSYPLKQFSQINASYLFLGFGSGFNEWNNSTGLPDEDSEVVVEDSIFLSKESNPFIFPAEGIIDFDNANIIGTAMVTKALSQGQFGQYPLYVFTSTGIWALGLNSEGDFVSKHAVSRDVALEGTIAPIDQAIVFTTKKGVMMLSGSDITSISPDMNGKHYVLDTDAATLLSNNGLSGFIQASQNTETFQQFMENAKPVYDYAGQRLVFGYNQTSNNLSYSDYKNYMYVYYLSTGTWHKFTPVTGDGEDYYRFKVNSVLNSYPDAIMSLFTEGEGGVNVKVINLSVVLDHSEAEGSEDSAMETGLIVTRPFDLDAPDVRKVIKDIRIRGQFNREDVKYILLGSFDGINWKRLTSLRGGSFKLFRMVIVANLSPNERISWIDVDYDTRFTNRLR